MIYKRHRSRQRTTQVGPPPSPITQKSHFDRHSPPSLSGDVIDLQPLIECSHCCQVQSILNLILTGSIGGVQGCIHSEVIERKIRLFGNYNSYNLLVCTCRVSCFYNLHLNRDCTINKRLWSCAGSDQDCKFAVSPGVACKGSRSGVGESVGVACRCSTPPIDIP